MKMYQHYRELKNISEDEFRKVCVDRKLSLHHTAYAYGYVSTKLFGRMMEYSGKFGKGIALFENNKKSSQFCFVSYYIEEV